MTAAGPSRREADDVDLPTMVAAGVLVYATALMAHESAHALVGHALGGTPTLISSTDARGDWSGLGPPQMLLVGASGSVVNGLLVLVGWLLVRRGAGRPTAWTAVGWLAFAVNAWIPTTYLVVSPAFGFGDWMTVIRQFPNQGPLRASLAVTGLFVAGLVWKETVPALARGVGGGAGPDRIRRARRLTRVAWASGGAVAVLAALFSPLEPTWAIPAAVGSTFGTTWPILPAAGRVGEHPVPGSPLDVSRSWGLLVLGGLAGLAFVAVFGPGIRPGG